MLRDPGGLVVERHARPPLGRRDVRVRVAYVGLCGTDLHVVDHPFENGVAPLALARGEITPGHEYSGVVEADGDEVVDLVPGTPVACLPRLPCGSCRNCRLGRPTVCTDRRRPRFGALAETITLDRGYARSLPPHVDLRMAALAEPTACALRSLDLAGLPVGASAVVIGAGPMGLLIARLLRHHGAMQVIVSETNPVRRELAAASGASVCDPSRESLADRVRQQSHGAGADVVFEVVGSPATVESAIEIAGPGARVVIVGVAPADAIVSLRPYEVFAKQLTIVGAWAMETTFERALELLGQIDADSIVTHEFELDDIGVALETVRSAATGKVLVRPDKRG